MINDVKVSEAVSSPIPSAVRLGELTTVGLPMSNGIIYEEADCNFRWPQLIHTCKMMSRDETVYAANNAIKSLIRRVQWRVDTPEAHGEKTEEMLEREQFIWECMHDMEHSWSDFVNESLSFLTYGFSLHEKVYKTRRGILSKSKYKSKFSDEKIGWAKLPVRSQDTVKRWVYDKKLRSIQYVEQDLSTVHGLPGDPKPYETDVLIPYNKLLHFRFDTQRESPEGNTPLKACYVSWKYKTTISEFEAVGVSRDMHGMPCIRIPPEYMSPDASEDKKAVYEYMKDVIRNLHMNEQAGLVFPRFIDPESKQDLFDFQLIAVDGSKSFDTTLIIDRYENKILMNYMADVLKMGQDKSTGSFALSDNKTNLMAVGIEAILTQLMEEINRDLVQQTALMNGWDISKPLPKICFEDLDERDLDKLGAFIQRTVQVGAMETDQILSDELRKIAKIPIADESKPLRKELLNQANQEPPKPTASAGGDGAATQANSNPKASSAKQKGVST